MDKAEAVAEMIVHAPKVVVFTGAGISTESGIPDFRSPGGLWSRFDPNELNFQNFLASEDAREKYWAMSTEMWRVIRNAEPNPGHRAIAELYELGKVDCVITQNVDNLHQKSGIPENAVIELHGTSRWVACLDCGQRFPREEVQARVDAGEKAPRCGRCRGLLKQATISFGQAMPPQATREAEERSAACQLCLIAGTSLVVYPAAQMPLIAKRSGAGLVIVNLSATPHDDYADVIMHEKVGEALPRIAAAVRAKLAKT
ncbi:MAG: Sir2 family NAD-dependent protein deacetylase [Chloroflexota bacterium]